MVNSFHRCKKSKNIVSLHLYPSLGTCYLTMNMMRSQQEVRYRKAWFLHQLPSCPPPPLGDSRSGHFQCELFRWCWWELYEYAKWSYGWRRCWIRWWCRWCGWCSWTGLPERCQLLERKKPFWIICDELPINILKFQSEMLVIKLLCQTKVKRWADISKINLLNLLHLLIVCGLLKNHFKNKFIASFNNLLTVYIEI